MHGLTPTSQRGTMFSTCSLWLATVLGIILSIVSVLKICSSCSETATYTLFGMNFGWFGIAYFIACAMLLALRRRSALIDWLVVILLFSAAGAEARFIWVQKYDIGQWCPICLWIASAVYFGCTVKLYEALNTAVIKGAGMKSSLKFLVIVIVSAMLGLTGAMFGVKNESEAAELDLFSARPKVRRLFILSATGFAQVAGPSSRPLRRYIPILHVK